MPYNIRQFENISLRDLLALDRTRLANSRTLLAYFRTAIMLAVSGITLIELLPKYPILHYVGFTLMPISIFIFIWGFAQYFKFHAKITLDESQLMKIAQKDNSKK